MSLVDALLPQNLIPGLVGKLQILLNRHRILDSHEHDRQGDHQATRQQAPGGSKLAHIRDLQAVQAPDDGCTCGLNALVETGVVGELAAVVGHGSHEPVYGALPGGIVETL